MKTVEVNIEGNSLLAYVTFYNEDILSKLNEMDEGEYDFIEFSSANQKESIFLGRGFCEDGDINLNVSVDGTELFNGDVYHIDDEESPSQEIKKIFQDEYGEDEDYEEYLVAKKSDCLEANEHFFADAGNYKYCSLETVQCYKSPYTIQVKVDDDFKLSDLSLVLLYVYSGDNGSIAQKLYSATRLERQVFGVKYKGEFFEFHGGNDEGDSNEIRWFERDGDKWTDSEAIDERIDDLEAW